MDESRKLIQHVLQWFPNILDAKLQLLDLERRAGNYSVLENLYEKFLAGTKSPSEFSLLSNKYARFMFKVGLNTTTDNINDFILNDNALKV